MVFGALFVIFGFFASRTLLDGVSFKNTTSSQSHFSDIALKTSYLFPNPQTLAPFVLKDQQGNVFTNDKLAGKWNLIFLGFTSCPDICPTTMATLSQVYKALADSMPLQVIFLSVDPKRDTVKRLADYMDFFNPNFIAVTAEHAQLYPLSKDLGMIYAMVADGDSYTVDHSGSIAVISPNGKKVAVIKPKSKNNQLPSLNSEEIIYDISKIYRM